MKYIIFVALFLSLNLYAETASNSGSSNSSGNLNNNYTSINNGGGCSQTSRSLSDLAVLAALFAILAVPSLKKKLAEHKTSRHMDPGLEKQT